MLQRRVCRTLLENGGRVPSAGRKRVLRAKKTIPQKFLQNAVKRKQKENTKSKQNSGVFLNVVQIQIRQPLLSTRLVKNILFHCKRIDPDLCAAG